MTVKELINKLRVVDDTREVVVFINDDGFYSINSVGIIPMDNTVICIDIKEESN